MIRSEHFENFATILIPILEKGDLNFLINSLTNANFDRLIRFLFHYFVERIERLILQKNFTFWGAIQLDKNIRDLIDIASKESTRPVSDVFVRLRQICSILQLEKVCFLCFFGMCCIKNFLEIRIGILDTR